MKKQKKANWYKNIVRSLLLCATIVALGVSAAPAVYATRVAPPGGSFKTGDNTSAPYQCGSGANAVRVSIDFGCQGKNCKTSLPKGCSAMLDAVFAIVRFLSVGVGVVVVASMVWAGLQYTMARADPNAIGQAKERILNNLIALLIYIFSYAILNYVIPRGFFH